MIKLHHTKADLSDIRIANLYQIPNTTFSSFWNGGDSDYMEYMKNFRLNYSWDVDNIEQLHKVVSDSFNGFIKATSKSIRQFNFLLRAAMKHRNLPNLEVDDYMKLEIDLSGESQEVKDEIKNRFYQMNSRSFVDFRSEENDKLQKRKKMFETIEHSNKELVIDNKSLQSQNELMQKHTDELEAMLKDLKAKKKRRIISKSCELAKQRE